MEPEKKSIDRLSQKLNDDNRVIIENKKGGCNCAIADLQKEMNPKLSKKIKAMVAILLVIIVTICGFGYYEYVYTRTPSYTLMLIGKEMKEHDVYEFNKHVAVKEIVANYLDDQYQKDASLEANPFAKVFWHALSNVAQEAVQSRVNEMVAGEKVSSDEKGADNPIVKEVVSKSKLKGKLSLVSVDKLVTNPDRTIEVKVVFKNKENNKEETALIMMRPLNDGTWQIYKIKNLDDLLTE